MFIFNTRNTYTTHLPRFKLNKVSLDFMKINYQAENKKPQVGSVYYYISFFVYNTYYCNDSVLVIQIPAKSGFM